jgi:pyruvate-ferredoxin/flavodoxin oxidoreductase
VGENPFQLDSAPPKVDLGTFVRNEARFRLVEQQDPERFKALLEQGKADIKKHFAAYTSWTSRPPTSA